MSTTRQQLLDAYQSLSSFEQVILQLVAIVDEPVSKETLANCLRRSGILQADGSKVITSFLPPYLQKLQKLKLLDDDLRCQAEILETLCRSAVAEGRFGQMAGAVQDELPAAYYYGKWPQRCLRALRDYRIGIYLHGLEQVQNIQAVLATQCIDTIDRQFAAVKVCCNPFDSGWFKTLPLSLQFYLLDRIFAFGLQNLEHQAGPMAFLASSGNISAIPQDERVPFYRLLANYLFWQGNLDAVQELIDRQPEVFSASGFAGSLLFVRGETTESIALFNRDLKKLRNLTGKRNIFFHGIAGLLYFLALLRVRDFKQFSRIRKFLAMVRSQEESNVLLAPYAYLEAVLLALENRVPEAETLIAGVEYHENSIALLFAAITRCWLDEEFIGTPAARALTRELDFHFAKAESQGFGWLAFEYAALLFRFTGNARYGDYVNRIARETRLTSVIETIVLEEPWQRRLKALISISSGTLLGSAAAQDKNNRLVWLVNFEDRVLSITPKIQKRTAAGGWSKGRPVALSRLKSGSGIGFLTDHDLRICSAITQGYSSSHTVTCEIDFDRALPAMIGHPLLFLDQARPLPVEFVRGEPEIMVSEEQGQIRLSFTSRLSEAGVAVVREAADRFRIIEINDTHRYIARIVGDNGMLVPATAIEEVTGAIRAISSVMTVHSTLKMKGVDADLEDIREVQADPGMYVRLQPVASGFRLGFYVKPFKEGGPCMKPGTGAAHIFAEVGGFRLQTRRDLQAEHLAAMNLIKACPQLGVAEGTGLEWLIDNVNDCLEILLELQQLGDQVVVEWPEGRKLAVSRPVTPEQLRLQLKHRADPQGRAWFEVSGNLAVDESMVLDISRLLQLFRQATGRFIPLGEGQFLALTRQFRRQLEELMLLADMRGAETGAPVLVHPMAVPALDELSEQAGTFDSDGAWKKQLALYKQVRDLEPQIPSTLQAELRDYQAEGFVWLNRLACLGAGACLADDMGLGKTLQALSLILERAPDGPSLVVAPTSVCMNWEQEANRFAPTLNIYKLGSRGRGKQIANLGAFDVLITSYTMLQQEQKLLAGKEWQTIVLDEAQAIKNMETKRSRAAMALKGRFRMITTGTPIENHLGELWNLFNFLNPGLLGSLERFNRVFAGPIERFGSIDARRQLRRLIRPYILRRLKSQVLEELPPRTEIILHVEMNKEEAAFYEALRRKALASLESGGSGEAGRIDQGVPVRILAEIMRLRRACCNTRLVLSSSKIPSSKLKIFGRVVSELLENRHKALVFSQFTGHLAIIREYLDSQGINYCYLDGSTPVQQRQEQVAAFQGGEGDLFLISLKAGGQGLNLTAADYVIHMDPWWNPAVEDQASDRVHRIGQKHPVTIYRLMTRNTIEEKIVLLHQEKRHLADSLLQGSDLSARLSAGELLNLIREG